MNRRIKNTKLYAPNYSIGFLKRSEIEKKLDKSLEKKLLLITASVGFGKTSALTLWSKEKDYISWLILDKSDDNVIIFFSYLIESIRAKYPSFGLETESILKSNSNIDFAISSLLEEIAEKITKMVLIIDNLQFIENKEILNNLELFINNLPNNFHIIISSRKIPEINTYKLKLNNDVYEIKSDDLRFTEEEEKEFLKENMSLSLSEEEFKKIRSKTEGWIAGIKFISIALQEKKHDFIKELSLSNELIEDYLTNEVLAQQDQETRDFLLKTCILNNFNYEICDYLLNSTDSFSIIEKIKKNNLFIYEFGENLGWFKYHNQFREILLKKLKADKNITIKDLYTRIIDWLYKNDNTFEAVSYCAEIKDYEKYGEILDSTGIQTILKGEFHLFKSLAKPIPEIIISKYPVLCICLGWANCLTHELNNVDKYIEYAENVNENLNNNDIYNYIEVLKAYYYTLYSKADLNYFAKCINLLVGIKDQVHPDGIIFSTIERILGGLFIVTNEWTKASELFKKAISSGKENKNYLAWVTSVCNYAFLLIFEGKLRMAKWTCEENIKEVSNIFNTDLFPILAYIYYPLSKILYLEGNSKEAIRTLLKSIDLAEKTDNKFIKIISNLELALIRAYEGELPKSLELLNKIEILLDNIPIYNDIFIEFNLLKLWVIHKKTDKINEFEKEFLKISPSQKNCVYYRSLIYAQILINKNMFEEAEKELKFVLSVNPALLLEIEALILYSINSKKTFNLTKARELIKNALEKAHYQNILKPFVYYFNFVEDLITNIYEDISLEAELKLFLKDIIDSSKNKVKLEANLVENLSERELEILKYLAEGLTNKEIADTIYVATGTIKKHTNAIYSKLNVVNRVSAIQKAKEIGLI